MGFWLWYCKFLYKRKQKLSRYLKETKSSLELYYNRMTKEEIKRFKNDTRNMQ